jgi:nucleoside-diphosphate-sugar epimerase
MEGVEFVFHLAAMGSVPRSLEMPERYTEVNVTGTMRVLQAARSRGSSCRVFGEFQRLRE